MQNELWAQQFGEAQKILKEGRLSEGCQRLMALYNQGYNQETIYLWLYEQSVEPNDEALEEIYEENRKRLDALYPEYFLPARAHLFYQAFPLEGGEFALFNTVSRKFIYENPDEVQLLHLLMQADTLSEPLEEEQEAVLAEAHRRYVEFGKSIYDITNRLTDAISQPSQEIFDKIGLIRAYNPYDERDTLLYGKYYLQIGDYKKAEAFLEEYMQTNQHSLVAIVLTTLLYKQQGRKLEEAHLLCKMLLMQDKILGEGSETILKENQERLEELKKELPEKGNLVNLFPYMENFLLFPAQRLEMLNKKSVNACAAGNYAFPYEADFNKWNQFIGLAATPGFELQLDRLLYLMRSDIPNEFNNTKFNGWSDIKLDTRPSKTYRQWKTPPGKAPMIYSILVTGGKQKLEVKTEGKTYEVTFSPYLYRDMRLKPGTEIKSDQPFIMAKPVKLGHSPRRKKLCLNIFLDAGSYQYLRSQDFSCAPNIRAFFEKGIIFDNNYTTGEYTWPVYPTLMTGTYLHRNQFYLDKSYTRLSKNIPTLTDRFSKEGYYCFGECASLSGVSTRILRSFDKILSRSSYNYLFQDIVSDLIDQLESYRETDQFVWFYSLEMHKIFNELLCPPQVQTLEPFVKVYGEEGNEKNTSSVHQKYSWRKTRQYQERWKHADFWLGVLFRYIEEHYKPEEYVITLFSDHGVTAVDNEEFLLKPSHTRSCFMVRGAGVPERGIVRDEMTSAADLYPTVCHLAGVPYEPEKIDGVLPKAFGGPGREYAYTESLFPGQTYKLCVRDLKYELRFISDAKVLYDGHVNLDKYTATLLDRETLKEIDAPEEKKRMMRAAWQHANCIRSLDPPPPTGEEQAKSGESAEDLSQVANL
ncbi:MAG: sulfatase-like hydrolase/transferase [Provencibacterium sp.]|jgi:hypothetical protein|nr:sulfatase-like hydrolase/transferase [Provencibacterium sp.]